MQNLVKRKKLFEKTQFLLLIFTRVLDTLAVTNFHSELFPVL